MGKKINKLRREQRGQEMNRGRKEKKKEGEDEKLPHLDSCHVNSLHTNTHTHLVSMIVKKLCNNLLSLYDGFLICFTRGFQSQL